MEPHSSWTRPFLLLLLLLLLYNRSHLSCALQPPGSNISAHKALDVLHIRNVYNLFRPNLSADYPSSGVIHSPNVTHTSKIFNGTRASNKSSLSLFQDVSAVAKSTSMPPVHSPLMPGGYLRKRSMQVTSTSSDTVTPVYLAPSINLRTNHFHLNRSSDVFYDVRTSDQVSLSDETSLFPYDHTLRSDLRHGEMTLLGRSPVTDRVSGFFTNASRRNGSEEVGQDATFHRVTGSDEAPVRTLHIGGLFELSSRDGPNGYSELDAALLAIDHINSKKIIPGYKLKLLYNDSKCDAGYGTDAFFDLINRKLKNSSLVMMMGSTCSEVTKTIAEIVPYWNLILVSYAETSPALREREKYRTFFSLALGDSALNPARRMLVQNFKWDKVAALYEDHESLSLAFNDINKDFSAHDIVIKSSTSFKDVKVEVPGKLKEMVDLDVRIILAGFKESTARQVFCQAFKLGMYSPRYVWILVGLLKSSWWTDVKETTCSVQEMATAVEGAFIIFSLNGLLDGGKSVANLTSSEFREAYINANGSLPMSIFAGSTYDTIWTMALTLRQATAVWSENGTAPLLHRLNYDEMAGVKETFITTMENLEFPGVSGPVSFKGSDREGITAVYQIQVGNFTQVAIHQPGSGHLDFTCDSCHKIYWKDERVPKDEQVVVARPKTIDRFVFFTSSGLCSMGVVMAVCFLSYNLYHRRLKYIKLSSPKLNNVAVVGCILVYLAVIMLGLDDRTLSEDVFPIICTVRAFLLAAGFSLAFGAMFAKTFRVHQIFTRAHHGLVKSKLIQDTHLLVIIGVLLAVDSSLVLVWVLVDPMSRLVYNTTTEVSAEDEDLIFQEQLTTCHSSHLQKWLGAFYAYKGLLLIFGVYMAWETRRVKIPALNDSKYIGLNVYNVVIMSVSVVVISNILSSQPTLAYAMEASFMFLSTTVTLCLLFVPKIYALVTSGGNPVIACTGILVDNSNTRRFVFDDRKEIYYRAEVQNRVYKREIVELDQKVARLETLLELPYEPYPTLIDELMYYLPDSKSTGHSRCLRRYKKELERCNSISDGGDGVVYDSSENDDILTEMGFSTALKPAPSTKKRSQAGESNRRGSKTFQKLTRSWSIGAGSRIRRKRKSLETSNTLLPFSSSESNFMSSKDHQNSRCSPGTNVPNCSDAMTYQRPDSVISVSVDGGCEGRNFSASMLDKITQTNSGKEVFTRRLASFKSNKQPRECASREGEEADKRARQNRSLLSSSGSTRQGKLFSVHQLHIEMVEEDSASNNEDTESLAGSSTGCMSPGNEASAVHLGNQVHASANPQKTFSQNHPVTWFGELQSPPACPAPTMYLTPYEHSKDGPENVRRLSAPSPSFHRGEVTVPCVSPSAISLTTTVSPLEASPSPLCLSTSFVQHNKDSQELSKSDLCLSCPSRESVSSVASSPFRSPSRNLQPLYAKGDNSNSKVLLHMNSLSALIASTHSLCSSESFTTSPPPSPCSSSTARTCQTNHIQKVSVSIESQPELVSHSSFRNVRSHPSLEQSHSLSPATECSFDQQEPDTGKVVSHKVSAENKRRQRIQQLQADLVKIQNELHELTNVETSEV